MYELSLNVDKKDGHFLDYLARQLDRPLAQARGVSALEEIDDRTFFSLACYDESAGQMSALVKDLLADIFSIGYKNKYLSKKLNMGSEDLLSRTLINTMCIFDNSYDKTAIKRNLHVFTGSHTHSRKQFVGRFRRGKRVRAF